MQVRILDSMPGHAAVCREWHFGVPILTLRQLIRERVTREVAQFNRERPDDFQSLVPPLEPELLLNGERPKFQYLRPVDPEAQFAHAIQAFERQRFLVIAGGKQVESLDEQIDLTAGDVEFIKLVPLVGG